MTWEHSSAGRASALQAEGHRFEPYCSHHNGPVVQLVRTLACHARGRGFESHPGRHSVQPLLYASVAQLVEQGTENPRVVGSIPTGGTTYADLAHLVERDLAKVEVAGSIPVIRSKKTRARNQYVPVDFCKPDNRKIACLYTDVPPIQGRDLQTIEWRHSQVVRQRSAKPLSPGSNPGGASKKKSRVSGFFFLYSSLFSFHSSLFSKSPTRLFQRRDKREERKEKVAFLPLVEKH